MESKELYRHLLGISEPWTVERVHLDLTRGQVDVSVGHPKGTRFPCPECGQELAVYDHSAKRTWRHLDSCQFMTYLHASPPRVACPEHGVRQARLPWADVSSRFTRLFEALAINVLLAATVERAAGLLRISWDHVGGQVLLGVRSCYDTFRMLIQIPTPLPALRAPPSPTAAKSGINCRKRI